MNFDWDKYFDLAECLKKTSQSKTDGQEKEACLRSSISRTYYGVLHYARKCAENKHDFQLRPHDVGGQTHTQVRDHFKIHDDKITDELNDLRKFRNECDYDDEIFNLKGKIIATESKNKKIIKLLNNLPSKT